MAIGRTYVSVTNKALRSMLAYELLSVRNMKRVAKERGLDDVVTPDYLRGMKDEAIATITKFNYYLRDGELTYRR